MADIAQVLATGGTTILGVVVGAGLTYWLGAVTRKRQEEREDRTRWYEARREAYVQLNQAIAHMETLLFREQKPTDEERQRAMEVLRLALSTVRLVGSSDAHQTADNLQFIAAHILDQPMPAKSKDKGTWSRVLDAVEDMARQDLGYPDMETEYRLWLEREERRERMEEQ